MKSINNSHKMQSTCEHTGGQDGEGNITAQNELREDFSGNTIEVNLFLRTLEWSWTEKENRYGGEQERQNKGDKLKVNM